jgi:hypothetical protein
MNIHVYVFPSALAGIYLGGIAELRVHAHSTLLKKTHVALPTCVLTIKEEFLLYFGVVQTWTFRFLPVQ